MVRTPRLLVTGASRGIGRAIAVALAAEGCRLALVGRDRAALEETAALCREAAPVGAVAVAAGGAAAAVANGVADPLVVVADVTDASAGNMLRETIDALGGELDLVANVAGSPGSASLLKDLDDADWEAAFDLHVLAPARLLRVCHHALASAGGAVVNIGSIAANAAVPRSAAYSAAKAGLASLTRATAIEWARDGIRANLVEPGYVATEFNSPLIEGGFEPALLAKVPTRRAVTPESVAQAVLFAGRNPDMTGSVLRVDGGQTARLSSKVISLDEAVALIPDGSSIGTGGILMTRKPVTLLDAIGRLRRDLTLWTMLGSVDAEVLAVHGALRTSNAIYVGFEQLGFAPAYDAAIASGEIEARDWSEFLFMGGLRASLAGLPFLPTRGGAGSRVTEDLGISTIVCPYTGEELAAAPAIRPDFALLHAEVADEHGNIPAPEPDFLFDFDANVARASTRVIVSVERIAPVTGPMLLYGHEVDAVVVAPGGARPSAVPGVYGPDLAALRAYLQDPSLERLV